MTTAAKTALDDLAFLRSLADGDVARLQQALFGRLYFGAGLIYGAQVAFSIAQNAGIVVVPGGDPTLSAVANAVFLAWLAWEIWRNRRVGTGSMVNKAINAAFAAVGAANGVAAAILIIGAIRFENPEIASLIPCLVFALQGTAWFVAYILRRRHWLGAVALGWTLCAIGMAFYIQHSLIFLGLVAFAVLFCMVLPGFAMMRNAGRGETAR